MSDIEIIAMANLQAVLLEPLQAAYAVHQRLHETDPEKFRKVAPRIRAIAATGESSISAELMRQLPALEIISVMGVGYDGVDVAAAQARGVAVTHTPGVLNDDVADLAMALMLAWARQLPRADRFVRAGQWPAGSMPLGRRVSGARLGIVGMGRIGQAIAQRASAFGMRIAYTARSAKADLPHRYLPTAAALAAQSDFLVVITPGGTGTRQLIDAEVLAALGPQGCLVNVARGSVIDEGALIAALESGAIAGAALDVFDNEPHVPQALREMDNVVLTPHIGSATGETRRAMADLALANLQAHFAGNALLSPVPEC
ncbi:2-hydroxyacid dehydrogenase [Polaromonas hydrogenivorans]|uniref:2-hydroxyacid dehydrogenase n=1 Tax=Polaromonas hydrogenivorans TaxID=335476 RepID=A0AAU7LVZ4_9BURK